LDLNAIAVDNLKSCYNILENNSKFSAFVNSDIVNLACKKLIEL